MHHRLHLAKAMIGFLMHAEADTANLPIRNADTEIVKALDLQADKMGISAKTNH